VDCLGGCVVRWVGELVLGWVGRWVGLCARVRVRVVVNVGVRACVHPYVHASSLTAYSIFLSPSSSLFLSLSLSLSLCLSHAHTYIHTGGWKLKREGVELLEKIVEVGGGGVIVRRGAYDVLVKIVKIWEKEVATVV